MIPIIIAAVLLILVIWAAGTFGNFQKKTAQRITEEPPPTIGFKQCPMCLKTLKPGERVRTIAYPGEKQRLVHLLGCPDCQKGQTKARCPVCHKRLKPPDYLIGKLWEEKEKNRVHVIGCNRC